MKKHLTKEEQELEKAGRKLGDTMAITFVLMLVGVIVLTWVLTELYKSIF